MTFYIAPETKTYFVEPEIKTVVIQPTPTEPVANDGVATTVFVS